MSSNRDVLSICGWHRHVVDNRSLWPFRLSPFHAHPIQQFRDSPCAPQECAVPRGICDHGRASRRPAVENSTLTLGRESARARVSLLRGQASKKSMRPLRLRGLQRLARGSAQSPGAGRGHVQGNERVRGRRSAHGPCRRARPRCTRRARYRSWSSHPISGTDLSAGMKFRPQMHASTGGAEAPSPCARGALALGEKIFRG